MRHGGRVWHDSAASPWEESLWVGAVLEQQRDGVCVTVVRGQHDQGISALQQSSVAGTGVARSGSALAHRGCERERERTDGVGEVGGQSGLQRCLHELDVASPRCVEELVHAVEGRARGMMSAEAKRRRGVPRDERAHLARVLEGLLAELLRRLLLLLGHPLRCVEKRTVTACVSADAGASFSTEKLVQRFDPPRGGAMGVRAQAGIAVHTPQQR